MSVYRELADAATPNGYRIVTSANEKQLYDALTNNADAIERLWLAAEWAAGILRQSDITFYDLPSCEELDAVVEALRPLFGGGAK